MSSKDSKKRFQAEKEYKREQGREPYREPRIPRLLSQRLFNQAIAIKKPMNWSELENYLQTALAGLLALDEEQMKRELAIVNTQRSVSDPAVPAFKVEDTSFYRTQMRTQAEVLTGLWRLRSRLLKPGTEEPLEETKRAYRHFETAWDALVNAGFRVEDYTKQPFRTGLNVDVLAYEEAPGLSSEIILETVKPGVFYNDTLIQRGEVIVGTPEEK